MRFPPKLYPPIISSQEYVLDCSMTLSCWMVIVTHYFDATLLHVDASAMLRYFKRTNNYTATILPSTVPSLTRKDVEKVNECVKHSMEEGGTR